MHYFSGCFLIPIILVKVSDQALERTKKLISEIEEIIDTTNLQITNSDRDQITSVKIVKHESCNPEFLRSLLKEDVVLIINPTIFFNIQTETFSLENIVESHRSQLFEVREQTDKTGTNYNDKK